MLLVFEKMFESRLFFVDKLIGMGARIVLCDPHRAVISGPSPLKGGDRRVARHPAGYGDAARGPGGRRGQHDPQRRSDRARLRADRRAPPGAWARTSSGRMTERRRPEHCPRDARIRASPPIRIVRVGLAAASSPGSPVVARSRGRGFDLGLWSDAPVGRGDEPLARVSPSVAGVHGRGARQPGARHRRRAGGRRPRLGPDRGGGRVGDHGARRPAHRDDRGLHSGLPDGSGAGGGAAPRGLARVPPAGSCGSGLERLLAATGPRRPTL